MQFGTVGWYDILTPRQLAAYHEMTASLDRRFAKGEREFYESRTREQLQTLAAQAFAANERFAYVLARSYAVKLGYIS